MRTMQLAGSLLLGTVFMLGCTENTPTELTDTPVAAPIDGPVLNTVGNDGDVIHMCYMPHSGNVYRIKEPDLKQGCRSGKDVEFSFNVQGLQGPPGVKGDKGDKGDLGPQGPPGAGNAVVGSLEDGECGQQGGWCPGGLQVGFFIPEPSVSSASVIVANVLRAGESRQVLSCSVNTFEPGLGFHVRCDRRLPDGSTLNYAVFNP